MTEETNTNTKKPPQRRRRRSGNKTNNQQSNRATSTQRDETKSPHSERSQGQKSNRGGRGGKYQNRRGNAAKKQEGHVEEVVEILLPPASVIQEYEYAAEGSGERLISMVESEQAHRHAWENHYLKSQIKSQRIGQLFGVFIAALTVFIASGLANAGQDIIATVIAVSVFGAMAISGVVGSVLTRRKKRYKRR